MVPPIGCALYDGTAEPLPLYIGTAEPGWYACHAQGSARVMSRGCTNATSPGSELWLAGQRIRHPGAAVHAVSLGSARAWCDADEDVRGHSEHFALPGGRKQESTTAAALPTWLPNGAADPCPAYICVE